MWLDLHTEVEGMFAELATDHAGTSHDEWRSWRRERARKASNECYYRIKLDKARYERRLEMDRKALYRRTQKRRDEKRALRTTCKCCGGPMPYTTHGMVPVYCSRKCGDRYRQREYRANKRLAQNTSVGHTKKAQ